MKTHRNFKNTVLAAALFACCLTAIANDTIRLTWYEDYFYGYTRYLSITTTVGEQFTIDWGDGSDIDTITSVGGHNFSHIYYNYHYYSVTIAAITPNCQFISFWCGDSHTEIRNRVIALDVSGCTALLRLYCSGNELSVLDVSGCTALKWLDCNNNQLLELDLSECTALERLNCSDNQISVLDLSNNTLLRYLYCHGNQLNALDISKNTALGHLYCSDNQLSVLDLSKNTLGALDCSNNQLTALDISQNTILIELYCSNNQLTLLDLSKNKKLETLQCSNNQLTVLDIPNAHLYHLSCYDNLLQLSNLYNISKKSNYKYLGTQRLLPQEAVVNTPVDFSSQKKFDGIETTFTIRIKNALAPLNYYTEENGIITFHRAGNYTVTMTNSAIVSDASYPAQVIADISVLPDIGIEEVTSYELQVTSYEVFDILGRCLASLKSYPSLENFPNGVYIIRTYTNKGILISKIIKFN